VLARLDPRRAKLALASASLDLWRLVAAARLRLKPTSIARGVTAG
jgi:multidrug resistance efflux pump